MTTDPPPLWIRSMLGADRIIEKSAWLLRTGLGRFLCMSVPPGSRDAVTAWVYGNEAGYRPGKGLFESGLLLWELEAVGTPPFPPSGRVLVGGVGGGREMVGLGRLGYEVVAFEPSPLVEAASLAARDLPGVRVVKASYGDVVSAARGEPSPLTTVLTKPFDGVVLGWGSLSHVVTEEERRHLLPSLKALVPNAPVLCSFWSTSSAELPGSSATALRRIARRLERFQEPGLRFLPRAGFVHVFRKDEFYEFARRGGYRVVTYAGEPFPHAVLAPLEADGATTSADRESASTS